MDFSDLHRAPHRRFNPLTREWVLVSPHRTQRPWQGKVEERSNSTRALYDPGCYLCPGNERAAGARTPQYASTFVFDNDYSALLPEPLLSPSGIEEGLLVARAERGICRVACFSPRHDLTIADMSADEMRSVVGCWVDETSRLARIPWIQNVQIFENHGELMGASNPHPHCQIWATSTVPTIVARETESFAEYRKTHARCMLCDYVRLEAERERIVCQNDSFVALVPYWAVWPFETLIVSKRHIQNLMQLSDSERSALGDVCQDVTRRYNNVFDAPFPYSMGFHQYIKNDPADESAAWHLHAHYYPPLLRSASIRKFMVGFELLGDAQRDFTPEEAASRLRDAGKSQP